jgi:hypothetical protein
MVTGTRTVVTSGNSPSLGPRIFSRTVRFVLALIFCSTTFANFDVQIDGYAVRSFLNGSLGLEHVEPLTHQCDSSGKLRLATQQISGEMTYTPNRRLQAETIAAGRSDRLQLGIILALGGL